MHSSINCSNVLTISDKVVNWHRKTKYDLTKFYVTQIRLIRIFYRGRHLSEIEIIFFSWYFFPQTRSFALTFGEVFFILIVHLWSVEYKKRYHIKLRILCDIYNRSENVKSFFRIKCHLKKEKSIGRSYALFFSCLRG